MRHDEAVTTRQPRWVYDEGEDPDPRFHWVRVMLVVSLIGLGGLICVFALVRWARVERAMRLRQPLPAFGLGVVMTVALALVALLLVIVLI